VTRVQGGRARRRTREPVDSQRTLVKHSSPATRAGHAVPARRRVVAGPHTDEVVLERYRLRERLGAGGFGVVWRAHDELLHRDVAVKRIWLGPDGDSERATREALATARLRHPAIVALYEACAHDGAFYLISELVEGDTLAHLIATGALPAEQTLEIGVALAGALSHAHARGVIHRDIKPQNVLVPARVVHAGESAKLTDFGGASLAGEDALTRTGDVLGTLAYMAPEQSEGAEVGEEADLYSLALVLYEALCGINPVRGPTPAATVRRIGRPLAPLARSRRDLPREVCDAIDVALAPAPAQRGSLDDLALAFEDTLERGLARRRVRPGARARRPARGSSAGPPAPAVGTPHRYAERHAHADEHEHEESSRARAREYARNARELEPVPRRPTLPRAVWLALVLAFVCWEAWSGLGGVSLLVLAAAVPALFVRGEDGSSRLPLGRLPCALAPVLGLVGLAGAFPAIAGQARAGTERAARGALAYWWLVLAQPLLGRELWLAPSTAMPARGAWEGSVGLTATHVIAPALSMGVLLGAALWAAAALVLPWLVRGRSAALDVVAVAAWAATLALAARALDSGLAAHVHPEPRGALLGAALGAVLAIAARALRGPI